MKEKILFTSESISEGHPDKVCDAISDAVLDACLEKDENSRVACECYATDNFIVVGGEITCKGEINYDKIARDVLKNIGYNNDDLGTNYKNVVIDVKVKQQSQDISMGVSQKSIEQVGAGDQGIMFGYATNETVGYMPLPISVAHKLVRVATDMRKKGLFLHARPDMKSQVTVDYSNEDKIRIDTIVMSVSHDPEVNLEEFKTFIHEQIMIPVAKSFNLNTDFKVYINPTGRFVIGGPSGDTGLTGRKIIVDTYGGACAHGGGAFSGKDPTKVDRTAAYMARYIAKNLVAAGASDRLEVQLSYAIGVAEPISVSIKTFGTGKYSDEKILSIIRKVFDCRPGMICKQFSLNKPKFKYSSLSNYGHFGRPDLDLPWEKLDKVEEIKKMF